MRDYVVVASCVDEFIFSIPDTISVEASFPIRDLEVQVLISHTWTGEICVTLRKENGPSVLLVENPGTDVECGDGSPFGCSSDHLDITLNDHGTGGPIYVQAVDDLYRIDIAPFGGKLTVTKMP